MKFIADKKSSYMPGIAGKLKQFFMFRHTEERISCFVILSIAVLTVFFILYRAEWILGDNFSFLFTTAKGKFYPLITVFKVGETRFFPFAFLDFNILPLIPGAVSAMAHYIYVAFSFTVFAVLFLFSSVKICDRNNIRYVFYFSALAFSIAVISNGFFTSFLNIIYPERVIIILFSMFIFFMLKYSEQKKKSFLTAALVIAAVATYFKETVSAFFVTWAVFRLISGKEQAEEEKIFNYALVLNGVVFIGLYYFFAWKDHGVVYHADSVLGIWQLMDTVFRNSALLLFIFPFAAVRLFKCLVLKQESIPVIDPLLAAAAIYALEYLVLGYSSGYYYAPALTAGALPVVYLACRMCGKHGYTGSAVILLLCLVPFVEIPSVSACINSTVIERTKVMPGLRKISALQQKGGKIYWHSPEGRGVEIYNLVNIYLNFIQKTVGDNLLTKTGWVPELNENDVFLYMMPDSEEGVLTLDLYSVQELERQKFRLWQFQTGFLVFMHEDNLK